jgi:site-specific recombinase XerD
MFRRGMDLYGIEKMLGHSDLEATMIYVDCKLPEWRKAYARSHELAKSSGPGAQE